MSKKIHYQFEGTDQVWVSEEYNLELNVNETRSRLGLPYWTNWKIIKDYDRTNPISDNNPKVDNPNPSNSGHQEPTAVPKRVRSRKPKPKAS